MSRWKCTGTDECWLGCARSPSAYQVIPLPTRYAIYPRTPSAVARSSHEDGVSFMRRTYFSMEDFPAPRGASGRQRGPGEAKKLA